MSDYLLVPSNVQAFLVGKTADPDTDPLYDLAPVPRTKDDLGNWYRDSKYSFSFQTSKLESQLRSGVHLHWALPEALMHARHKGRHKGSEKPEQSCIPNRWLVVRMWHKEGNKDISSKAWVIESDYVSDDKESGGTPFLFVSPSLEVKYLGRTVPLEGWNETHPAYRFELTSYGWGDPSFAAYYPACKGVLGFHDTMDGVAGNDLVTYLVIGWYSDPTKDPLHPGSNPDTVQDCTKRLAGLGWWCSDLKDAALPLQTLCHGGVVDIKWQGSNQQYPAPRGSAATVAIGGSAAEALAALLAPNRQKDKSLQQVLCAFHHGQATQVSDQHQLGELLHRHSFNAAPGGTHWSIEPKRRSPEAKDTLPPVSENVQRLLDELNQAQQALDQHAREIESLRWRLFACWVTWGSKQTIVAGNPDRNVVKPAHDALTEATTTDAAKKYDHDVQVCRKNVEDALRVEKTGMQLAPSTMPPFLHPKDPFVVMKGDNLIGINRARARRPVKDADGALRCRLAKDVVTGVMQSGTMSEKWSAGDCFTLNFSNAAAVGPGDIARTLALETLLFDPNSAGLVDTRSPKVLDCGVFDALQASLAPTLTLTGNTSTLTWAGQPPDPLGLTRWQERNPWLPVYLMWQAHWAPAYAPAQASENIHSKALDGWRLGSDALAGDLVAQPNTVMQPKSAAPLLEGVTIISALSGAQLAENLRQFAKAAGGSSYNLEPIDQTKLLGQSLGGFNDLLLRQALGLCLPPVDPTKENVEVDALIWGDAMGRAPQPVIPVDRDYFYPLRAGALKLVHLYIVDAFGQTRKLIDSSTSQPPRPIASAALPPPPDDPSDKQHPYHASFSPRLVQPARLNFDWQPGGDGASGPVCGWIVANFLEKSFTVFSAKGEPLGTLQSVLPALGKKTIDSKVTFKWHPTPGTDLKPEKIVNNQLQRFVLIAAAFTADEGQAFLELVDLVLRKTEAGLPPEDPAMAVLLGRPLALVHASLALEIQGLPAGYWKTDGEWKFETEGFEKLRVPVRLGGMNLPADGLVGYLPEEENCFYASEGATRRVPNSYRIKHDQQLSVACTPKLPLSLTLLMDASARVHATTGILPRHFIQLPSEVTKQIALIEEIYVSVAPVLGARPTESAAQPAMPRPSDAFGQWSWATRPALGWYDIRPADDRARFADGLALSEGWLKLRRRRDDGNAPPGNKT